ncbi:hypothetical protein EAI_03134 [Harpegnathos saltator]|uniref:Uncharacterized protein n=1 Tax=Harpegnathos saltator TaxID=610380 RepID=E2B726_HARSA|nr:hypothetical protein EAI_03134 [Harpegnathos saltator]
MPYLDICAKENLSRISMGNSSVNNRFSVLSSTLMYHHVLSKTASSNIAQILHRPIRELAFPEYSNMGVSTSK